MSNLANIGGGGIAPRSGGAMAMPSGTGAAGAANVSMVRMIVLLGQAVRALDVLEDVGRDLLAEATTTEEMANYLTASFGERISLEEIRIIAQMLTQIVDGSKKLVHKGAESVRAATMANFQVRVAQEQLHSLGADGAWVDSQRRAG
ncbi:hypothetical protein [Catenuloplanes japonicus]|uniref:hypothetical protein n=1 Tax=Catenuloplanes japonicus TaxID=33876 RepID=UPI000524AD7F|nr:hypothetical protein [Catenuloplanes japonicus]